MHRRGEVKKKFRLKISLIKQKKSYINIYLEEKKILMICLEIL